MKKDPGSRVETIDVRIPPAQGAGSGKAAWIEVARKALEANDSLSGIVKEQRAVIGDLRAEVKLLRDQIASRKPKGGRDPLPDDVIEKIERAFAAGHSTRQIGKAYGVSAMTASRVRKRLAERASA